MVPDYTARNINVPGTRSVPGAETLKTARDGHAVVYLQSRGTHVKF